MLHTLNSQLLPYSLLEQGGSTCSSSSICFQRSHDMLPRIAPAALCAAVAVEAQLRQQSLQRKLCMKCLMVVGQALGCLLCDESTATDTCEDLIPLRSNEGWQASKKGKSQKNMQLIKHTQQQMKPVRDVMQQLQKIHTDMCTQTSTCTLYVIMS